MMHRLGPFRTWALAGLIALAINVPIAGIAKTTGVGSDSSLETGPCYQALVDKNAETPSTAPNRELGDACRAENGDVAKAWARVIRLWGSDSADVPDYDSFMRADAPAPGIIPIWLTFASMILLYGAVATPMRSAAVLMAGGEGKGFLTTEIAVAFLVRAVLGFVLLTAFSFSIATLAGCILLIALLVRRLMLADAIPVRTGLDKGAEHSTPISILIADVINDVAGGAVGLLGLALLVNHSMGLFAGALVIGLVLSARPLLIARRLLLTHSIALTAIIAFLVASTVVSFLSEPLIAGSVGNYAYVGLAVPIIFALAVIALGSRTFIARTTTG